MKTRHFYIFLAISSGLLLFLSTPPSVYRGADLDRVSAIVYCDLESGKLPASHPGRRADQFDSAWVSILRCQKLFPLGLFAAASHICHSIYFTGVAHLLYKPEDIPHRGRFNGNCFLLVLT